MANLSTLKPIEVAPDGAEGGAAMRASRLFELQSISYAMPVIATSMLIAPMSIVQGVYATHYGLALSTLAIIILASRIFDAVTDPIIGMLSDRYRQRHGTRKPLILVGAILLLFSGYFLYVPPVEVTALYAGFWMIVFYLAFTLFEIPHISWPSDIAHQFNPAKLYTNRIIAGYCGLALFYGIPFLPLFPTEEITPETLKVAYFVAVIVAIPCLYQAIRAVPSGRSIVSEVQMERSSRLNAVRYLLKELVSNKPFLIYVGAFLCGGFAMGMWYGLIYIYVDVYLGMGGQFAAMSLIGMSAGILVAPMWYRVANKLGYRRTWMLAVTLVIISLLYTATLDPGKTSFVELFALKTLFTIGMVGSGIIGPSVLTRIVDYSHLKYRSERNATYFSLYVFVSKMSSAFGVALALTVASMFGFEASSANFTANEILGLKAAISWIPACFVVFALICLYYLPIDERRHGIILRRLKMRASRE